MEELFSSSSEAIINKKLDVEVGPYCISTDSELDFYFDTERVSKWIDDNQFKRVALQFPDDLLAFSIKTISRLKKKCLSKDCVFFLLADTSYGSCCVDVVAAEHYNADSILHFGHSCLSLVEKIPVFYVFEKLPLDTKQVQAEVNGKSGKIIVLYDCAYAYLHDELCLKFAENPNVFVSKIQLTSDLKTSENTKILFSREFPADVSNSSEGSYSFFYIGDKDSFLNPLLFYFNQNTIYQLKQTVQDSAPRSEIIAFSKTNRELMRRYYLIEKAKDAKIFGILIGTMSVASYRCAVDHVSAILKKARRRFYSFLIGKLNCPKLNNFMEVDMYVIVACNENSLINSKELNKPIITIYELEIAYNCSRLWGQEFICDYRQLLSGSEHHIELKLSEQESDVSLITGATRFNDHIEDNSGTSRRDLIKREDGLAVVHQDAAGEYLKNRTWTGLEQKLGETVVSMPIEGKKGIAMGYSSENF